MKKQKFKVGDKVRLLNHDDITSVHNNMIVGNIYTVSRYIEDSWELDFIFLEEMTDGDGVYISSFELANDDLKIVPNPIKGLFVRVSSLEELEAYEKHCISVGFKFGRKGYTPVQEFNKGLRLYSYSDNWEAWVLPLNSPEHIEIPFSVFALLKGITVYKKVTPPPIVELTMDEIAEKLGIDVKTLRIKE